MVTPGSPALPRGLVIRTAGAGQIKQQHVDLLRLELPTRLVGIRGEMNYVTGPTQQRSHDAAVGDVSGGDQHMPGPARRHLARRSQRQGRLPQCVKVEGGIGRCFIRNRTAPRPDRLRRRQGGGKLVGRLDHERMQRAAQHVRAQRRRQDDIELAIGEADDAVDAQLVGDEQDAGRLRREQRDGAVRPA